jgi:DnaJ family protein C protein 3
VEAARSALEPYAATHKKDATVKELRASIDTLEKLQAQAMRLKREGKWQEALAAADKAMAIASQSSDLRELAADCHLALLQFDDGIGELSRAASLNPSSASLMTRLSLLHYLFLSSEPAIALQPVKQCLRFDPDSKSCKKLFKALKKLDKDVSKVRNFIEGQRWASASVALDSSKGGDPSLLDAVEQLIESSLKDGYLPLIPSLARHSRLLVQLLEWTCQAQIKTKSKAASKNCARILDFDPDSAYALYSRGLDLMKAQEYEDAVRVLGEAFEKSGQQDRDIQEELQKARAMLKRSKSKDYYKVLGVSPDADERTIKKA